MLYSWKMSTLCILHGFDKCHRHSLFDALVTASGFTTPTPRMNVTLGITFLFLLYAFSQRTCASGYSVTTFLSFSDSVHIAFHEFLLDGVLASWHFAVRHVEPEIGPFVSRRVHARRADYTPSVGDGDGVTDTEVHSFHHALPLQFSSGPDGCHGRGRHVAAGTEELLAVVVVVMGWGGQLQGSALFHVLQTSPDDEARLLRYLHSS